MSLRHSLETTPRSLPSLAEPRRRHLLDLDEFHRKEIEEVLGIADAMKEVLGRDIKKVPTLRGKVVFTLFYESSTRTRASFEEAAKILSADVINVTASSSSVTKGESLVNTARTLQALGADVIVVRHPHSGAPYLMARCLERASVVNAGDGWHAHPTQALLDLYTMQKKFGAIQGLKVVIVGDVLHSRVARSNLWALTTMGAQVVLCGPPTLLPVNILRLPPAYHSPGKFPLASVGVETNLDRALEGADVVMALRLQLEHQQAGLIPSLREYSRLYQVNEARLNLAKPNTLVMHPGPINEGIEISPGIAHGVHSLIEEQVANGVAVRMALLYMLSASQELRSGLGR